MNHFAEQRRGEEVMTLDPRLSQIGTHWSLLAQAHGEPGEAARDALHQLLEHYGGAVRRYLLGVLRDPDAAEELFQEFAFRFLHGDLRGADRQRGRFRDFLKGVLFHLIADYQKGQRHRSLPLPPDHPAPLTEAPIHSEHDPVFLASWRDELLAHAWQALAEVERATGKPFLTVLRFRTDHPEVRSPQMAERLSAILGKPLTAVGVRTILHRAREKFADLLLEEIAQGFEAPTPDRLEEELGELGLLDHCRSALERRTGQA
jgi:RNA polymerase sigma-70 factor (ECF subfamily)